MWSEKNEFSNSKNHFLATTFDFIFNFFAEEKKEKKNFNNKPEREN